MRKTTAFSIAVLTLSTAALAQVGTTPTDKTWGNNMSASNTMNTTSNDTSSSADNISTPDATMTNTPDGN